MSLQLLNRSSALSSGSDLWVLPEIEASSWTAQLDWYLGFSILRSTNHKAFQTPEELQEILHYCDLEYPKKSASQLSPVMIHSERRLPNRWVVVLPTGERPETWINRTYHIWTELKRPSLRIFLPNAYSTDLFEKNWSQLSGDYMVTLVPAPTSH